MSISKIAGTRADSHRAVAVIGLMHVTNTIDRNLRSQMAEARPMDYLNTR